MTITPIDKKMLRYMVRAQKTLPSYVVIDVHSSTIYSCPGWEHDYIAQAFDSGCGVKIPLKPYEIKYALDHLCELKLVEKAHGGPACRVTYTGWYILSIRTHELLIALSYNVLIPLIIAVAGSVLTNFVMHLIF